MIIDERAEWLEADGMGGFASGTVHGVRTRRYHALLLRATTPPTGRMVLVNGLDAWAVTQSGRFALTTQRYQPGVLHPDGYSRITSFSSTPWPTWEFETADGAKIRQEIIVEHRGDATVIVWTLLKGEGPITLEVRPFFSGRDYHSMHHENGAFRFEPERRDTSLVWQPYDGVPQIVATTEATYTHAPDWYRNFFYTLERERGLDDTEDLASPGLFAATLRQTGDETAIVFSTGDSALTASEIRTRERSRRAACTSELERAADAYLVRRGSGLTIVAGYPWFTDWGRDTFISIRGLCIATGRMSEARDILVEWSSAVSEGMLPNRFPDAGETPEYNAVDASLWYVVAVHDFLDRAGDSSEIISANDRGLLYDAVRKILEGYAAGTRFGIRADDDGLLSAGQPGVQLTWMDARVDGREITPRLGKPVEVQALWLNALWLASRQDSRWSEPFERGRASFEDRFWNESRSCLYDTIDVDHIPGIDDPAIRPNQIFAVGGLPLQLITGDRAKAVVERVERDLLTPFGLRTLAPSEPGYMACCVGPPPQRDGAYHQGTVWPWLLGAFVDAWIRVHDNTADARCEARDRFVKPVLDYAMTRGFGHVCEITDAQEPFIPRGCPFQAWSLGELLRAARLIAAR